MRPAYVAAMAQTRVSKPVPLARDSALLASRAAVVRTGVEPVACPEAHYCPVGSSAALPCPAGTFGNASGLQAEQECHACPAGHFCGPGVSEPTPCSRGTVAPNENMVACNDCEAGTLSGRGWPDCLRALPAWLILPCRRVGAAAVRRGHPLQRHQPRERW